MEVCHVAGTECSTQSYLRSGGTREGIEHPCERRCSCFVTCSEKSRDLRKHFGVGEGMGR